MSERTMTNEEIQIRNAAVAVLKKNAPNISDAGLFEVATGLVKRGAVAVDRNGVAYLHDAARAGASYQWAQRILDQHGATAPAAPLPPLESITDPLDRTIAQLERSGGDPWALTNPGGGFAMPLGATEGEMADVLRGDAESDDAGGGDEVSEDHKLDRVIGDLARMGIDAGAL